MRSYVIRRCLLVVPSLVGVSLLTFLLIQAGGGDRAYASARRALEREPTPQEVADQRRVMGLDRPLPLQYGSWAADAVRGDLGYSDATGRPVTTEIAHRIPYTVRLAIPAVLLATLLAVPVGLVSAMHRNRPADQALRGLSLIGASVPSFWLALLLIDLFAVRLHMLPAGGATGGTKAMVLPVLTLALVPAASLSRFTRSAALDVLGREYVRTATAKGLDSKRVVERHVLRNALVPLTTILGGTLGRLLAGAVVAETLFAWPGIGKLTIDSITGQDFPVLSGVLLYSGAVFVAINVVVDMSYAAIDPRVRPGARRAG